MAAGLRWDAVVASHIPYPTSHIPHPASQRVPGAVARWSCSSRNAGWVLQAQPPLPPCSPSCPSGPVLWELMEARTEYRYRAKPGCSQKLNNASPSMPTQCWAGDVPFPGNSMKSHLDHTPGAPWACSRKEARREDECLELGAVGDTAGHEPMDAVTEVPGTG